MDQSTLINLGWQAAGWGAALLIVLGGPSLVLAGNRWLKAHTSAKVYDQLGAVAHDAVTGAEQYLASKDGQTKKQWVMGVLQAFLDLHGWHVPVVLLDSLVESNVHDMKTWEADQTAVDTQTAAPPADSAPAGPAPAKPAA